MVFSTTLLFGCITALTANYLLATTEVKNAQLQGDDDSILKGKVIVNCSDEWMEACWSDTSSKNLSALTNFVCPQHYEYLYTTYSGRYSIRSLGSFKRIPISYQLSSNQFFCKPRSDTDCDVTVLSCPAIIERPVIWIDGSDYDKNTKPIFKTDTMVNLTCLVFGGIPESNIKWIPRRGSDIVENGTSWTRNNSNSTPRPTFYSYIAVNLTRDDDGASYVCQTSIKEILTTPTEYAVDIKLSVQYPPVIKMPDYVTVDEFEDAIIDPDVMAKPTASVRWYREDEMSDSLSSQYTLVLRDVKRTDTGKYTCIAKNMINSVYHISTKSIQLYVKSAPVIDSPDEEVVREFDDVHLTCRVTSYPVAKVWWLGPDMTVLSTTNILVLNTTQMEDSGRYTCFAHNSVGNATKSTLLDVKTSQVRCPRFSNSTEHPICHCRSNVSGPVPNTTVDIQTLIEALKSELSLNRKVLTSYKIKKISAADNRPSSICMGFVGVVVILAVISFFISGDVIDLLRHFSGQKTVYERKRGNSTKKNTCNNKREIHVPKKEI